MNLWYPIGLLISGLMIYWSIQDDRLLRTDPDEFLRRALRGNGNFNLSVQTWLGRFARTHALELAQIEDPAARQAEYERRVLAMADRRRVLQMALWEIRFRAVAFAFIGLVLLYDWAAGLG